MDAQVQEMLDHHEIRKTLALYCHGCDRADEDLIRSVYTREGSTWKIKHRVAVHDMSITHRIEEDFLATNQLVRGSRDSSDPGVALLGLAHRAPSEP